MVGDRSLKRLFPYESRFINIAGYQMHYIDEGTGPVVLCLHGNPTWSFYFRHLIEELRHHFRVVAPDQIGMGLSDHPTDAHFRAVNRIDHLEEFVTKLGLTRYSMVMHDWGGSIGTGLGIRNVAAVERLVYLNTTLTETESLPLLIKASASPFIGKWLTQYTRRFLKFTTNLGVVHKLPRAVKKCYYYPYRTVARRTAIWDFVADIPFDSTHPSYGDMLKLARDIPLLSEVPVKIVWGLRDPCFHREMLTKVSHHLPQADILEIPDASHLVLEDARDIANVAIRVFLLDAGEGKQKDADTDSGHSGQEVNALYQAFSDCVRDHAEAEAVVVPSFLGDSVKYSQFRYREFYGLVAKYQRGLQQLGLARGDKVLMLVAPGPEFLALSYSVMGRGAIPVFLDPGMGTEKLLACIKEIQPDAFIGSPKAQLLRILKRDCFKELKFNVCASNWGIPGSRGLSYLKKFAARAGEPAPNDGIVLIAFTSGATGIPKGVVYSNDMIRAQLEIFRETFKLEAGGRDLPLLPIFSIFSLALGVSSVFPPVDPGRPLKLDPQRVVRVINDRQVTSSFGSPTLWKKIAEYCVRSRTVLHSVRQVFIAGAPVPAMTLEQVAEVMPEGKVYTPYGATEALPVTFVSADKILSMPPSLSEGGEQGIFVGAPVNGVSLKVVSAIDGIVEDFEEFEELPHGSIGEIIVSGKSVSTEYFGRPEITRLSKVKDSSGAVWHRMGDMGYRDAEGNLFFCGRKAHVVKTNKKIYYSIPCEKIFNLHPRVARSALVVVSPENIPAIVVEPHPQDFPETKAKEEKFRSELLELAASSSITSSIESIFFHPSFPVDGRHNAKIFRDQLGSWASEQVSQDRAA